MLNLMDGALMPSLTNPDKITYMTSIGHLQSVRSDNNCVAVVDKIKDLLSSKNTRLQGLQFLEIALQQNPDIYLKGRWTAALFEILKEPVSYVLKEHACKILCLIIPHMAKDTATFSTEQQKFASVLFPFLLSEIENRVEWIESAAMSLCACLKCFPHALESQKDKLMEIICQQISYSVSSKTFEVFAECFSFIPNCARDPNSYPDNWTKQYLTTLNSMLCMLNTFLTFFTEDPFTRTSISGVEALPFDDQNSGKVYPAYMMGVRRYINLSKCLAKMLSVQSKRHVQIPVKLTLECIARLFQVQDVAKISSTSSVEMQIVGSTLSQMQIASLVVVESLILNFPNILPYTFLITQVLVYALQTSGLPNISCDSISPLRQAVWRLMDQYVGQHGAKVSSDIISQQSLIIEEIFKDISIETSQDTVVATSSKSKKNLGMNPVRKSFVNKSQQAVCREALKALECLLYSGASFITPNLFQEIFSKVVDLVYAITPYGEYPFPYDDDMCRKRLYSVLLALAVVSKIDQREPIQCASGVFRKALQDPSTKVVRFCHKALATCRLYLHPKKPILMVKDSEPQVRASNSVVRFSEWATDEYVHNLPPVENVSNVSESINPRVAQSFHNPNEGEIPSDDYMQVDAHYSERGAKNQCNGEDILEIQNSSQCQDDVDSDDEDEEEDDERSYGDEEINQDVEMEAEHLYIPSTSKMQVLNPVHITPETAEKNEEQKYEELRPCKSDDSNKNMHLNGVRSNIVPEEDTPSASAQNVTSENGIYSLQDDIDEEEVEDEEDDHVYPAEKKVPEYFDPPAKKQKIDNETNEKPQEEREGSRSPTLVEMKADFCCNEVENVKS